MRVARLGILPLMVACAHHAPAAPQPASGGASVSIPIVYVSADSLRRLRAAQPPEDPRITAFHARYDSLAALVDTIVVLSPDSILLHVGEVVDILTFIKAEGRRASGEILPTYPGLMAVEDRSIADSREAGLTGVRVGRTRVVLTVMSRRGHAPPSYVPVRVIP
jgi:hypothetical protein